jgi:hypothetical protein
LGDRQPRSCASIAYLRGRAGPCWGFSAVVNQLWIGTLSPLRVHIQARIGIDSLGHEELATPLPPDRGVAGDDAGTRRRQRASRRACCRPDPRPCRVAGIHPAAARPGADRRAAAGPGTGERRSAADGRHGRGIARGAGPAGRLAGATARGRGRAAPPDAPTLQEHSGAPPQADGPVPSRTPVTADAGSASAATRCKAPVPRGGRYRQFCRGRKRRSASGHNAGRTALVCPLPPTVKQVDC